MKVITADVDDTAIVAGGETVVIVEADVFGITHVYRFLHDGESVDVRSVTKYRADEPTCYLPHEDGFTQPSSDVQYVAEVVAKEKL